MVRRALEIGAAVAVWQLAGYSVVMLTLTMRHRQGEPLKGLWGDLSAGWGRVTSGKYWLAERAVYGLAGYLRAVEVTWGRNGWHPHIHALLFVEGTPSAGDVVALHSGMFARWQRALERRGRSALALAQEAHLVTGPADEQLAEYLTKATDLGVGHELAWSQGKRARKALGTHTPWRLLDLIEAGDADALDLRHEFEQVSKGKRQHVWSQGMRQRLGIGREVTDEEVAAEEVGSKADDLVFITAEGWAQLIAEPVRMAQLLDVTEQSGLAGCRVFLDRHAIEHRSLA